MLKFPGLLLAHQPRVEGEDIGNKKDKKAKKPHVMNPYLLALYLCRAVALLLLRPDSLKWYLETQASWSKVEILKPRILLEIYSMCTIVQIILVAFKKADLKGVSTWVLSRDTRCHANTPGMLS